MRITYSGDFMGLLGRIPILIAALRVPYQDEFGRALALASPVDRTVAACETLYAAILEDMTLDRPSIEKLAEACGELALAITAHHWHGLEIRAALITSAMAEILDGKDVGALTSPPPVNAHFSKTGDGDVDTVSTLN